jgi:hypothetical protein
LLLSFLLDVWGINWKFGWHPDEEMMVRVSSRMVDQRSLNPHAFVYGPLHFYEVMFLAVVPAKIVSKVLKSISNHQENARDSGNQKADSFAGASQWWWSHAPILFSRMLSGLFGTGTVLLAYVLALKLFGRPTALVSALLLGMSMPLVVYSHFATVDVSSTFWFTLSCLISVYVWSIGGPRWSALSGLTAGVAGAVKYLGGLAIVPLIVAHVLSEKRRKPDLLLAMFMVIVGFLLGSPVVLFSFIEFLDGFSKEFFFNAARPADVTPVFWVLVELLKDAFGLPVFAVSICGLLYSVKLLRTEGERGKVLLVWSMFLPYCLVIGSHGINLLWYILPIIPFLCILNGKMFGDLLNSEAKWVRTASWVLLGAAASYSLVYTIGADLQFVKDSRYMAAEWIAENVPSGSRIEVACPGSPLPSSGYSVVRRPLNRTESQWMMSSIERRDESQGYVLIQALALAAERIGRTLGLATQRKPYVAWPDRELEKDTQGLREFDFSLKGLELRNPDYVVVCDALIEGFSYQNFFFKGSTEYQFYDALFRGGTAYKEIKVIRFQFFPWLDVEIPWVNPRIYILGRK